MFLRTLMFAAILAALSIALSEVASATVLVLDDFTAGPFSATAYNDDLELRQQLPNTSWHGSSERITSVEASVFGDREPTGTTVAVDPRKDTFRFQTGESSLGSFGLTYELSRPLLIQSGIVDRFRMRFAGDEDTRYLDIVIGYDVGDAQRTAGARLDARTTTGLPPDAVVEIPFDKFGFAGDAGRVTSIAVISGNMRPDFTIEFSQIELASAPLTGDYNRDGVVDLLDYEVWRLSAGAVHRPFHSNSFRSELAVDGNGDGFVDVADYTVWRDAYDAAQQAANQVPEPSAWLAAGFALIAAAGTRRRG